MYVTAKQLSLIYNISLSKCEEWEEYINGACVFAEINTLQRMAAFLAQIGHESGRLMYVAELWGPTRAQLRYEGTDLAKKLGNLWEGDGFKYRGHGLIQITGRYNHRQMTEDLLKHFPDVPDFEEEPDRLMEKEWAAISAAMYWKKRELNMFADNGDFVTLTKKINGGTTGLDKRQELFIRALGVLSDNQE